MRILIVSNYYPPAELGGWEQLTLNVAQELESRGHQVHVLTSNYLIDRIPQPEENVTRVLNLESPDHINYHAQYSIFNRRSEQNNLKYLKKILNRFKPDIIYINGMWNLPVSLAKSAEQLFPGRVVYYMASYWPTEMNAHMAYWSSPAKDPIRQTVKDLLGEPIKRYMIDNTPRNQLGFKLVLCVSSFIQEYVVEDVGVPRDRTRVVHNGINLDQFKKKPCFRESKKIRFLYAGRFSPDKGVHTILEGLSILKGSQPVFPIECSFFGGGARDYQDQLERYVKTHQLTEWVQFQGVVPRDEMPNVFSEHDVLLFPSIWPEPLARIVQEAMACGLVVIGTTTGGTKEILHDGINGLTFEAENAHMLVQKMVQVVEDDKLLTNLANVARQTVEEEFSLSRMVDEIEENFNWMTI